MTGAGLGRSFTDAEIAAALRTARVPFARPPELAGGAADVLAGNGIVAWFQGRSEYGPRALGHRSLLAHPGQRANLDRLNDIKGREKFRPVAPMVKDTLECFGSAPVDALAIGPFLVRRP